MTTMVTRAAEGTTLTFTQLDGNFKKVAQAKTADYTIVVGDNRDTIEFNGSSLTATLPAASTITTSADTGDFEVTIKNINASALTIARNGTDTIDGATSLSLVQYASVTLKVNQAANGWNIVSSLGSTKAAVSGYTRLTPNYCYKDIVSFTSLTLNGTNQSFTAPTGSKLVEVLIQINVMTKNATGVRGATVDVYDSGGTTQYDRAIGEAYEWTATASTLINTVTQRILAPVVSDTFYMKPYHSGADTNSTASYSIVGYYD